MVTRAYRIPSPLCVWTERRHRGVSQAVFERECGVPCDVRAVHRLQEEMTEVELLEVIWVTTSLRKHELELVSRHEHEGRAHLRTHADPVDASRRGLRAVRLDRDGESSSVQRVDGVRVELQQRLAAGADDKAAAPSLAARRPSRRDGIGELVRRGELAAVSADAEEIRVAELANGICAIFLSPGPQVASRESQEHRRASRVKALALQRVEDLLRRVAHRTPLTTGLPSPVAPR